MKNQVACEIVDCGEIQVHTRGTVVVHTATFTVKPRRKGVVEEIFANGVKINRENVVQDNDGNLFFPSLMITPFGGRIPSISVTFQDPTKKYWVQEYKQRHGENIMHVVGDNNTEICYTHSYDAALIVADALNKVYGNVDVKFS